MNQNTLFTSTSSRIALRQLSKTISSSSRPAVFRPVVLVYRQNAAAPRRSYSTERPLIRVTDIPAPNSGHIRILELNRPEARNAISRDLLKSLRAEIDVVHAQYDPNTGEELPSRWWKKEGSGGMETNGPTRALILASAVENSFCAGADLKERKGFTQEQ